MSDFEQVPSLPKASLDYVDDIFDECAEAMNRQTADYGLRMYYNRTRSFMDNRLRKAIDGVVAAEMMHPSDASPLQYGLIIGSNFACYALRKSTHMRFNDHMTATFRLIANHSHATAYDLEDTIGLVGRPYVSKATGLLSQELITYNYEHDYGANRQNTLYRASMGYMAAATLGFALSSEMQRIGWIDRNSPERDAIRDDYRTLCAMEADQITPSMFSDRQPG